MRVPKRLVFPVFLVVLLLGSVVTSTAGVPMVDNTMVTDVTTVSFSVIWSVNESATANLEVFDDEDGLTPTDPVSITPHPVNSGGDSIRIAAENNGVMKVRVTGLKAGNTYYFKTVTTSKSTSDITTYPSSEPYTSVTTEIATVRANNAVPFSNNIIIEPCYLEDGNTPAEGTLLLATINGVDYPLTSFVGDGVELPNAIIDLNNAFGRESKETLEIGYGKDFTLLNFRGILGNSIVNYEMPENGSNIDVRPGEMNLLHGWNMVSWQLEPTITDINETIVSLGDKLDAIWTFNAETSQWLSIDKSVSTSLWNLTELNGFTGYWFVMNNRSSLLINGNFATTATRLYGGWNLVAAKSIETVNLLEAVAPIFNKIEAIWTFDKYEKRWCSFDKNIPQILNDLFVMEPGKAYWFVMDKSCDTEECMW